MLEILPIEPRVVVAVVVRAELAGGTDRSGEEAASQRGVSDEADAELAQQWQRLRLGIAGPQGVFGLQRGDRVDRVRAADGRRPGLREADVTDLAVGDECGEAPMVSSMGVSGSTRCW